MPAGSTPAAPIEPHRSPDLLKGEQSPSAVDPVEAALAQALEGATKAARWDVVAQLATELEARRRARQAPAIVDLETERARRAKGGQQ